MKKMILGGLAIALMSFSFTTNVESVESRESISVVNASGGKIKLINDTSEKLRVHTGSGTVTLNPKGGSTSFSCNPGKSIKVDGEVVFKVTEDMCGETIKLSEYL